MHLEALATICAKHTIERTLSIMVDMVFVLQGRLDRQTLRETSLSIHRHIQRVHHMPHLARLVENLAG